MGEKAKKVKVRVLADINNLDGKNYKPNDVVALDAGKVKALEKAGQVDSNGDAVEYALSEGAKVIDHDDASEGEPAGETGASEGGGAPAGQ